MHCRPWQCLHSSGDNLRDEYKHYRPVHFHSGHGDRNPFSMSQESSRRIGIKVILFRVCCCCYCFCCCCCCCCCCCLNVGLDDETFVPLVGTRSEMRVQMFPWLVIFFCNTWRGMRVRELWILLVSQITKNAIVDFSRELWFFWFVSFKSHKDAFTAVPMDCNFR